MSILGDDFDLGFDETMNKWRAKFRIINNCTLLTIPDYEWYRIIELWQYLSDFEREASPFTAIIKKILNYNTNTNINGKNKNEYEKSIQNRWENCIYWANEEIIKKKNEELHKLAKQKICSLYKEKEEKGDKWTFKEFENILQIEGKNLKSNSKKNAINYFKKYSDIRPEWKNLSKEENDDNTNI